MLAPSGDYAVVESLVPGCWFALHFPTMRSLAVENLPENNRTILERRIDVDDAIDILSIDELLPDVSESSLADDFESPLEEGIYDKHILKAVFVAGSGGAGKGQVIDAAFPGEGLKLINQDTHLERFLKDAKIPFKDAGKEYGLFRKARELKDKELRHYANRRLGLVIDSTGWAYDRIAGPVKKLRELGYDVSMIFVDVSLKTALRRNKQRADAGGRDVPDSFIRDAQSGAERNMKSYMKLFGQRNFFYLDNDKDMPPERWQRKVGSLVRKYARAVLKRPIRNPKGRAWLKKQQDPKTADYNNPDAPLDWPKPPEPVYTPPKEYKHSSKKSDKSLASKYPSLTKSQKASKGAKLVDKFSSKTVPLPPKKSKKKPSKAQTKKYGKQPDGSFKWPGIGESQLFLEHEADPFGMLDEAVQGVVDMIKSENWQVVDLGDAGWFRVYSAMPVKPGKAFSVAHTYEDYKKKSKTGELKVDPQIETDDPRAFAEEVSKALRALGVPKQRSVVVFGGHDKVKQGASSPSGLAIRAKHVIHLKRGKRSHVSLAHEWAHHLWWRLPKKSREWFKQWFKRAVVREIAVADGTLKKGDYDSNLVHNLRELLKTKQGAKFRSMAKKKGLVPSEYAATEYAELFAEAVAYAAVKPSRVSTPLRKAIFNVIAGTARDADLPPKMANESLVEMLVGPGEK